MENNFLAKMFRRAAGRVHQHHWVEKDFRRECGCGARQLLMENRFPDVGQPALEWVTTCRGDYDAD